MPQDIKQNQTNIKLIILFFLIFAHGLNGQALNKNFSSIDESQLSEEYLESLPIGVRKDLLEKIQAQKETEKPTYRRASTMLDKLEKEELKTGIFGEDIFDMMQSTFMPINEPNIDSSYILDFGDIIELQLVGQKDSIDTYEIKRDGSINIPEIGKLFLSGLSLNDAGSLIKTKIQNAFIGTNAFISLTSIRDIQILITGNAYNPGIYTLNGNSNVLHALTMAGGMSTNGSYRDIKIIRNDKVIKEFDLYDLFIFGKTQQTSRLRSGDSIMVGPLKNVVNVSNGVNRSGLYELKEDETLEDLIKFANGFNSNADKSAIQVQRLEKGIVKIFDVNINSLNDVKSFDKDSILISEYKYNTVKIIGAVKNPGTFITTHNETIKDLISRAGGYDDSAYPFGGYLKNKKSIELNEAAKEKLYNEFLNQIIEGSLATQADTVIPLVLEEIRNTEVSGRVIAEFDLDVIKANPEKDTLLEDGDEIMIPRITQQVYVYGEVNNQGATRYKPNKTIDYYLKNGGGTSSSADLDNIFIVQPNGLTQSIKSTKIKLSFIDSRINGIPVYPGSIIFVPKEIKTSTLESAAIWGPIISSLALSLTSLSVLDNQ